MKPYRLFSRRCMPAGLRWRRATAISLILLATSPSPVLATQATRSEAVRLADARAETIKQADGLVRQRSYTQAERAVEAAGLRAAGTPEWELEAGHGLMEIAFARAAEGDTAGAMEIVARALKRLERAAQAPSREGGSVAAQAKQLGALLQERFVGDREAAKRLYREAVQLDPHAKSAAEALDRLERADAARAARAAELKGRKSS